SFLPAFDPEDLELYYYSEPEEVYNQETGEMETRGEYSVKVYVVGTQYYESIVDVDLRTRDVFDLEGNVIGRWLWWINPEQYPLEGQTGEVYRYDWHGQQIGGFVSYISEEAYDGWGSVFENRVKGTVDEIFMLGQDIDSYESVVIQGEPHYFSAGICYNAATGMPIWSYGVGLCDDVTAAMTGMDFSPYVIMKDGWEDSVDFVLLDTNLVPTEYVTQGSGDSGSILPYVFALLVTLLIVAGVMAYRRR
ncbi:MAG TPA: hypothetical protein PLC12_03600, partial [Candidatus Methanofastidiosa archaeon]|nr:hypothetical protein [Candidatus Methanofastidiosa archaeon]